MIQQKKFECIVELLSFVDEFADCFKNLSPTSGLYFLHVQVPPLGNARSANGYYGEDND